MLISHIHLICMRHFKSFPYLIVHNSVDIGVYDCIHWEKWKGFRMHVMKYDKF